MRALEMIAGSEAEPLLVWGLEGEAKSEDSRKQAVIDGSLERKRAAMAAHQTQIIIVDDETFQYSNLVPQKISAVETYRLLQAKTEEPMAAQNSMVGELEEHLATPLNSAITAVAMGLLVGFIGSMYHTSIYYFSDTAYLPWGLILALLLVFSATTWTSLRAGKNWAGTLVGCVTFLVISLFAFAKPQSILVLVNPQVPVGVAGTAWMLGSLGVTILSNVVVSRIRARRI